MKLATLRDDTRDGQLAVVSRDLSSAVIADGIAGTLQRVLDDWTFHAPQLQDLSEALNAGRAKNAFPFDATRCLAPLPRAYQWADGSAYVNHVERVRQARKAEMPASFWTDPLMYQGGSDDFLAPTADAVFGSEDWGIDFEGEIAVVTDAVAMGTAADAAGEAIRLLLLVNDWSLRDLIPAELAKGFGFFHGKPATAFGPVAITPDELGEAWRGHRVHRPLLCDLNGQRVGRAEAGEDMVFDFAQLIAHAAKTRNLGPGTIVGSGTVSNRDPDRGWSCIAEARALETIARGEPVTPYMRFGDRIRIEVLDAAGRSVFGAIDQRVTAGEDE